MSNMMIQPRSSGRWVMVITAMAGSAAVLLVQGIIFGILGTSGLEILLKFQFSFLAVNFNQALSLADSGIKAGILSHFYWDFGLLVVYSAAGYSIIYLLMTPKPRGFQRLAVGHRVSLMHSYRDLREKQGLRYLPVIAGLFDLGENVLELLLIQGILPVNDLSVFAASLLSCGKFLFIILSVLAGLWTLIRRLGRRHIVKS